MNLRPTSSRPGGVRRRHPRRTWAPAAGPAGKTPAELRLERRLAGPAFAGPGRSGAAAAGAPAGAGPASGGDLAALLQPTVTEAASARVLPTQQLLLPKGAFLDCTLETAIDSSLSGMTTCVLATDSFGADGSVVLLERGTKLVGETRGQVRAGSARIFVLWTEARTPKGVVVPLVSPGTDELGRSGLPGKVNRHFFERFGAAILVSVIDGAVQAAVAVAARGGRHAHREPFHLQPGDDRGPEVDHQHPADRRETAGRSHPGARRARPGLPERV